MLRFRQAPSNANEVFWYFGDGILVTAYLTTKHHTPPLKLPIQTQPELLITPPFALDDLGEGAAGARPGEEEAVAFEAFAGQVKHLQAQRAEGEFLIFDKGFEVRRLALFAELADEKGFLRG